MCFCVLGAIGGLVNKYSRLKDRICCIELPFRTTHISVFLFDIAISKITVNKCFDFFPEPPKCYFQTGSV